VQVIEKPLYDGLRGQRKMIINSYTPDTESMIEKHGYGMSKTAMQLNSQGMNDLDIAYELDVRPSEVQQLIKAGQEIQKRRDSQ